MELAGHEPKSRPTNPSRSKFRSGSVEIAVGVATANFAQILFVALTPTTDLRARRELLRSLHRRGDPLLLPNAWDVATACDQAIGWSGGLARCATPGSRGYVGDGRHSAAPPDHPGRVHSWGGGVHGARSVGNHYGERLDALARGLARRSRLQLCAARTRGAFARSARRPRRRIGRRRASHRVSARWCAATLDRRSSRCGSFGADSIVFRSRALMSPITSSRSWT